MKSYKNLFARITDFANLHEAARLTQKGKRFCPETLRFNYGLERELLALQEELLSGAYQPGGYRAFYVNDPKHRRINVAPYRDRVVHHAICNILAPLWDSSMIADTYACRKGKGTHQAILRFNQFARRYPYVLKCDISKFYDSIDHAVLKKILFRRIPEVKVRALLAKIVDSAAVVSGTTASLPIGNLTSQWFANLYLSDFDYFVKTTLCCPAYVRYMDDFAFFAATKTKLHTVFSVARDYLAGLGLTLVERKCNLYRVTDGVNFLGFKIFPTHRLLLKRNIHRVKRRLCWFQRRFKTGDLSLQTVRQSMASWRGHARWGDTYSLCVALQERFIFTRDQKIVK
jgi:retron-type reverse transcriptase